MWTGLSYVFLGLCVLSACRPRTAHAELGPPEAASAAASPAASSPPPPDLLALPATDAPPPAPVESAAPPKKPRRARRVLVLGDSLSDPKVHGGGYLQPLGRCPDTRIENYAKGGFMVNQMRRRFEEEVVPLLDSSFTDVVVFGGVNDLYSDETAGRTVTKISADLTRIFKGAKARGLRVVALTVSPWGGFSRYYNERRGLATLRLNDWIREQARAGLVDVVVDTYPLLSCGVKTHLCADYQAPFHDGIHFGKLGHQKLGAALLAEAFRDCSPEPNR
ncbi:MAG: SGNH/GDSL hydrolase family protein [Polyangiaceae bacterium]